MSDQTQLDRFIGEKIPVIKELEVTRVDSFPKCPPTQKTERNVTSSSSQLLISKTQVELNNDA